MGVSRTTRPTVDTSTTQTSTDTSGTREIGRRQDRTFTGPSQDPDRDGPSIAALNQALNGAASEFNQLWDPYTEGWLPGGTEVEVDQQDGSYDADFQQFESILPEWADQSSVWGQVQQTSSAEVADAVAGGLPPNSLLYVAFGPENLPKLDLAEEITALQGGIENLVVVWNPSQLALRTLTESGAFTSAVVAGHGAAGGGGVYMTDQEGRALPTPAAEFAALFEGTSIETVFLNACNGLEGENSVADALNEIGVSVLGWVEEVADSDAVGAAEQLAALGEAIQDGASPSELEAVANAFDGAGGNLVAQVVEEAGSGDGEEIAEAAQQVFPAPPAPTSDDPYAGVPNDPYYAGNYAFYNYV